MARHTKGTKQLLSISLDAELVKRVENLADASGMSRSAMIEQLIDSGIDQSEMTMRVFSNPALTKYLTKAFTSPEMIKAILGGMKEEVPPNDMQSFQQGIQLLDNYCEEFSKGQPPEVVAEKTMKKTVSANKKARRGRKPKAKPKDS